MCRTAAGTDGPWRAPASAWAAEGCRRLECLDRGLATFLAAAVRAHRKAPIRPAPAHIARQCEPAGTRRTPEPAVLNRAAAARTSRRCHLVERVDELFREPSRPVLCGGMLGPRQGVDDEREWREDRSRDNDPRGGQHRGQRVVRPPGRVGVGPPRGSEPQSNKGRADSAADRRHGWICEDLAEDLVHCPASVRSARHLDATAARHRLADF